MVPTDHHHSSDLSSLRLRLIIAISSNLIITVPFESFVPKKLQNRPYRSIFWIDVDRKASIHTISSSTDTKWYVGWKLRRFLTFKAITTSGSLSVVFQDTKRYDLSHLTLIIILCSKCCWSIHFIIFQYLRREPLFILLITQVFNGFEFYNIYQMCWILFDCSKVLCVVLHVNLIYWFIDWEIVFLGKFIAIIKCRRFQKVKKPRKSVFLKKIIINIWCNRL